MLIKQSLKASELVKESKVNNLEAQNFAPLRLLLLKVQPGLDDW